jgi:hypothetical protein
MNARIDAQLKALQANKDMVGRTPANRYLLRFSQPGWAMVRFPAHRHRSQLLSGGSSSFPAH